jgi:23S rRNA pseudouridine2605 synthase
VLVNGRPAEIGQAVRPQDRVVVDGRDVTRLLNATQDLRVILYHKPGAEMLKSRAGDERAAVPERLPSLRAGRWLPVNALGFEEEGLLLLTNDGPLAASLARKSRDLPLEYRVRVLRPRMSDEWPELPVTVDFEERQVEFDVVEDAGGGDTNRWFRVRSKSSVPRRAVRALFDAAGLKVSRVMLVGWGPVALPRDLPRGRHREVERAQFDVLLDLAGRPRQARGRRGSADGEPLPRRAPAVRPKQVQERPEHRLRRRKR